MKSLLLLLLFTLNTSMLFSQTNGSNLTNYKEAKIWFDGTSLSDSKLDGDIYKKINGKFYKLDYIGNLYGNYFGTTSDDLQDDSDAIQKAINYAIKTSQNIIFPSGNYFISKTIVIPQHFHYSMKPIKIDFSNATLHVSKDITVFQSDNWGSKIDSKMSNGIVLSNFEIDFLNKGNSSYAIQLQDYHQGSKLENIAANNVKNLIHSKNNYYLELYNINSNYDGKAGKRYFFEGYHGLNKFSKLSAVNSEVCYSFEQGMIASVLMESISVEGCKVGINFSSEVYSFILQGSYIENFETAFVFQNYIHSANIDNNYFNFLNKKNINLLDYKGLPANNLRFGKGNNYIGTDYGNLIKNKENLYGKGIIFEIDNISADNKIKLQNNAGKNILLK